MWYYNSRRRCCMKSELQYVPIESEFYFLKKKDTKKYWKWRSDRIWMYYHRMRVAILLIYPLNFSFVWFITKHLLYYLYKYLFKTWEYFCDYLILCIYSSTVYLKQKYKFIFQIHRFEMYSSVLRSLKEQE